MNFVKKNTIINLCSSLIFHTTTISQNAKADIKNFLISLLDDRYEMVQPTMLTEPGYPVGFFNHLGSNINQSIVHFGCRFAVQIIYQFGECWWFSSLGSIFSATCTHSGSFNLKMTKMCKLSMMTFQ